jgi:UDPglucose--hexose-1-phosphate uridylyltransferase
MMPVFASATKYVLVKKGFEDCQIAYLNWYNSCFRIISPNRDKIISFASEILHIWNNYQDEQIGLIAHTQQQHNAITPIVRKVDQYYHLYLILRNNRTNKEYPDGIFHAHQPFHNIKKESIGLIEAMGLFILPGRLKKQFAAVQEILMGRVTYLDAIITNPDLIVHKNMIAELLSEYGASNSEQRVELILEKYINDTCKQILECTAIFKNTSIGDSHLRTFLSAVGLEIIGG